VLATVLSVSLAGWYVYQRIRSAELSLPAATAGATLPQSPYELTQRAALLLQRQDRPGNVDGAIRALEEALKLDQNNAPAHASLADAYRRKNSANPDPQWVRLAQEGARRALDNDLRSRLALYLVKSNQTRDARVIVNEIEREPKLTAPVLMRLTVIHELAGNRDRALQALGQAVAAGYSTKELSNEPELTTLRADARYHRVVAPPATSQEG
jgi:tetratricopeptide (TPR) repeat protein